MKNLNKILREEIEKFDLGPLFEAEFNPLVVNEDLEYWGMNGNQLGPLDEEDDDLQWVKDVPVLKVGDIVQVRGYEDMGEQGRFEILNVTEDLSGYNVRNIRTMRNQFITIDLANRYLMKGEWYKIG